jgi:hypothetical protein
MKILHIQDKFFQRELQNENVDVKLWRLIANDDGVRAEVLSYIKNLIICKHTDKPASIRTEYNLSCYEFAKRIASTVGTPKINKSMIVGLYLK